jgi:hypothetical protein
LWLAKTLSCAVVRKNLVGVTLQSSRVDIRDEARPELDLAFRREVAERVGLGFVLPSKKTVNGIAVWTLEHL